MNMKQKMITFAAGVLLSLCGSAQSLKECQTVVEFAVESINTKSTAGLKAHLADDFSCLGQKVGTEILSRQKTLLRMKERKILFVE